MKTVRWDGAAHLHESYWPTREMSDEEFFAKVATMHDGGAQLIANADAWFEANPSIDPATGKRRA